MSVLKIKVGDSDMWMHQQEYDNIKAFEKKQKRKMYHVLFNDKALRKSIDRGERNRDNRKYVIIKTGKNNQLACMDKVTEKAYRLDKYEMTWMEIKRFEFVRWATSFDL